MSRYNYEVAVTNFEGKLGIVTGQVMTRTTIIDVWDEVIVETFNKLTEGKAVFGQLGVGCKGPYRIRRVTIEEAGGE